MAASDALRQSILEWAKRYVLTVSDDPTLCPDGKRHGWETLKQIFDTACETRPGWSTENLKALQTRGMWLTRSGRGGTKTADEAIHWCGIFATFILIKAGLGVKWRSGKGIISSSAKVVEQTNSWIKGFDRKLIQPGDVCAIQKANHHFIVIETQPTTDVMRCIAGNGRFQQIEWQTHSKSSVVTHYRLL